MADDLDLTSYVVTVRWPGDGNTFSTECNAEFGQDCVLPEKPCENSSDETCPYARHALIQTANLDDDSNNRLKVFFSLVSIGSPHRDSAHPQLAPDTSLGIPVRFASMGRLLICSDAPCAENGTPIATMDGSGLQLGWIYAVPASTGTFHSGNVTVATSDDGTPKSVEASRKAAVAQVAGALFNATATQAQGIATTIETGDTARLKAKTDALTAQKAYQDALAANSPDQAELKDLQSQAALLNDKAQLLAAQKAAGVATNVLQQ